MFLRKSKVAPWLLEFSYDGEKFYCINDRNVVRLPPYDPLRERMNRVIGGATEAFEAHYDRFVKVLAIIAWDDFNV